MNRSIIRKLQNDDINANSDLSLTFMSINQEKYIVNN